MEPRYNSSMCGSVETALASNKRFDERSRTRKALPNSPDILSILWRGVSDIDIDITSVAVYERVMTCAKLLEGAELSVDEAEVVVVPEMQRRHDNEFVQERSHTA